MDPIEDDILEFPETDSAEQDWRPKFKLRASQTAATRLRGHARDARQRIRGPLLKIFDAALRDAYETGDYRAAEAAFARFDEGLLKGAMLEFERLRKAAGNGIEDFAETLTAYAWNGLEIDSIARLLEPGERLARVDFRWIETSKGRRIGRPEVQHAAMPSTQSNGKWGQNFISEDALRELELEAEAKRNAPPPWSDSRNRDFPNGIRQ